MSVSRKKALKRLNSLALNVELHLQLISDDPHSDAVNHWRFEVRSWLKQMLKVLPFVGGKTSEVWQVRIEQWAVRAEE
jgi:hypothetical protein